MVEVQRVKLSISTQLEVERFKISMYNTQVEAQRFKYSITTQVEVKRFRYSTST